MSEEGGERRPQAQKHTREHAQDVGKQDGQRDGILVAQNHRLSGRRKALCSLFTLDLDEVLHLARRRLDRQRRPPAVFVALERSEGEGFVGRIAPVPQDDLLDRRHRRQSDPSCLVGRSAPRQSVAPSRFRQLHVAALGMGGTGQPLVDGGRDHEQESQHPQQNAGAATGCRSRGFGHARLGSGMKGDPSPDGSSDRWSREEVAL